MFDSEFECGNLEYAIYESTTANEQPRSFEVYKLLVQNDYNGFCNPCWFNFTVTNFQPLQIYKFQIGPFTQETSPFSRGKLPWVAFKSQEYVDCAGSVLSKIKYSEMVCTDNKRRYFLEFYVCFPLVSSRDVV